MSKLISKQVLIPLVTFSIILFLWFGPVQIPYVANIIILLLIILANYIEYDGKPFTALGFKSSKFTVKNMLVFAPLVALIIFGCYVFILVPGVEQLTGEQIDYSNFKELEGNLPVCLIALALIWSSAAFGEEIIFRGYFMRQFVKFFGESHISIILNIVLFAVFFGFMHGYQGITGQIVTGIVGGFFAWMFYKRKYDLWFNVAVHGFVDTISLICIYLGLA